MNKREVIELLKPHTCGNCYFYGFITLSMGATERWCGGPASHVNHPIPESRTCSSWTTEAMLKAIDRQLSERGYTCDGG